MDKLIIIFIFYLIVDIQNTLGIISDKRLCADPECKVPISIAVSTIQYYAGDPHMLSFKPRTQIRIFSKSAGSNMNVWGGEINGKRGYVPLHMIRETKVFTDKLEYVVSTELKTPPSKTIEMSDVPKVEIPEPNEVLQPHAVIDGTTVYFTDSSSSINATADDSLQIETEKIFTGAEPEQDLGNKQSEVPSIPELPLSAELSSELEYDSSGDISFEETSAEEQSNTNLPSDEYITAVFEDVNATKETKPEENDEITIEIGTETTDLEVEVKLDEPKTEAAIPESNPLENEVKFENGILTESIQSQEENLKGFAYEAPKQVEEGTPKSAGEKIEESNIQEEIRTKIEDIVPEPIKVNALNADVNKTEELAPPESEVLEVLTDSSTEPTATNSPASFSLWNTISSSQEVPENEKPAALDHDNEIKVEENLSEVVETSTEVNIITDSINTNESEKLTEKLPEEAVNSGAQQSINELNQTDIEPSNLIEKVELVNEMNEISNLTKTEVIPETKSEVVNIIQLPDETLNLVPEVANIENSNQNHETLDEPLPNEEQISSDIRMDEPHVTESSPSVDVFSTQAPNQDIFNTESTVTEETVEYENEVGFFDGILDMLGLLSEKSEILSETEYVVPEEDNTFGHIFKEPVSPAIPALESFEGPSIEENFLVFPDSTFSLIIYLGITSVTILIFTLGYYYIEKLGQDGSLIKRINELEKALLNSDKDRNNLRNELEMALGSEAPRDILEKLESELMELNQEKNELEELNFNLERELETATEAGLELNKMLAELLNSQQGGDALEESLEIMRKQLNDQQITIAEMTIAANEKNKEFQIKIEELNEAKMKLNEQSNEINSLVNTLTLLEETSNSKELELNNRLTNLQLQFDETIESHSKVDKDLKSELNKIKSISKKLKHSLNVKEKELVLLQESITTENKGAIIEVSNLKAELSEVQTEKEKLTQDLSHEINNKYILEKQIQEIKSEKEKLLSALQKVEQEKIEIQTRLDVLSSYFKEKEQQLQKELSKHEHLWLQNKGETNSTIERIKLLQEEIQNYKSQNEMLKNEIVDQEISMKSQISVLEKKTHQNWLLLRQAERRLEDSKQECSQLRNRLTSLTTNEEKTQFRVLSPPINGDINEEPPVSPSLLYSQTSPPLPFGGLPLPPPPAGIVPFMPPPPPGIVPFMPPPPSMYPGDHRPPPLGRMSSPPPPPPSGNTFSPTRPYSMYDQDRDSPPLLSPNNRTMMNTFMAIRDNDYNYRHRSPPPPHYSSRTQSSEQTTSRSKTNTNENV